MGGIRVILTGDWTIEAGLRDQWAIWQSDCDALLPEMFRDLTTVQQAQVRAALGPTQPPVPIHLVAPLTSPPTIPSIWIGGGGGGEQADGDVIGQAWGEDAATGAPIFGVWIQQSWRITAYGVDLLSTLAMATLIRWALYRQRLTWGQEPPAFVRQTVQWQDWEPVPDGLLQDGVFPFTRPTIFTVTHADTWTTAPPPVITAVDPVTLS